MRESEDVASTIRSLRAKLQLSQEELAGRLNVSFATVNRWENGKSKPQGTARDAIAKLAEEAGGASLVSRDAQDTPPAGDHPRHGGRNRARQLHDQSEIPRV